MKASRKAKRGEGPGGVVQGQHRPRFCKAGALFMKNKILGLGNCEKMKQMRTQSVNSPVAWSGACVGYEKKAHWLCYVIHIIYIHHTYYKDEDII